MHLVVPARVRHRPATRGRFNATTGAWLWLSGSNFTNATSVRAAQRSSADAYSERQPAAAVPFAAGDGSDGHGGGGAGGGGGPAVAGPGGRSGAVGFWAGGGELWLFGGEGRSYNSTQNSPKWGHANATWGVNNELWAYSIANNSWSWLGGNSSTDGDWLGQLPKDVMGQPIEDGATWPRPRTMSAGCFAGNNQLWVFGGGFLGRAQVGKHQVGGATSDASYSLLSDLWAYDLGTGRWSALSGLQAADVAGLYPRFGASSTKSRPGARMDHRVFCGGRADKRAMFVYGGFGYDQTTDRGLMGDVWYVEEERWEWEWLSGRDWNDFVTPMLPVPAGSPTPWPTPAAMLQGPGTRRGATGQWDGLGRIWIFGGLGYDAQQMSGPTIVTRLQDALYSFGVQAGKCLAGMFEPHFFLPLCRCEPLPPSQHTLTTASCRSAATAGPRSTPPATPRPSAPSAPPASTSAPSVGPLPSCGADRPPR
jgi:hypothetical protein